MEELLKNRREVGLKLCRQIRQNNFQMINAKNFLERPYLDREKKQKFNTTNYLRLLAAEKNIAIRVGILRLIFIKNIGH